MKTKMFAGASIAALIATSGCTTDREHNRRHWVRFRDQVHDMHTFIDKHLFDYDVTDPRVY